MYYNKFKYQYGGRADFLYDVYDKLASSGLLGNMKFEDFAQLPPEQQKKLIQQLTGSNLNQYKYSGRMKAQTSNTAGGNVNQQGNNQGNLANNLFSWGKNIGAQNATGLAGSGASMIGNLIAGDKEAYTPEGAIGNAISGIGTGVASGAAFGPVGALVGGGLGLLKSIIGSVQAGEKRNEEIKEDLKPRQMGQAKSSYNPQLTTFRYGGSADMEAAYAKSRANLSPNEYSFSGKGKINIDSEGIKRAGYQVGGNTEMRAYPEYRGQQLPFKFFNEYQTGGRFKPQYELQDGGEAEVEVESGEAIMADPRGLTLHGGAYSENESPVGMMVKGAEHGEKNLAGTEGIPVSFNNPNMNPDGAFVYSKYLTPDGKLAKGKGDTPRDSVAGKVKPLLKFAENAMSGKAGDRYYNNPAALQAVQEEMQYLKDRAMEGKFMHGLDKMLKKKNRNFSEIIDYIKSNNPTNETKTIEGVGSVDEIKQLNNNQQPDPNSQMLEQVKNQTLTEMNQEDEMNNEQLNPEENMMMRNGGQLPQDILESRMRASGASQDEIDEYVEENYKKGGWIQDATASIKRRGTEGVCTGSKFGGPTCPPGSKRYNLAKTFRKMAKNRQEGGYLNPYDTEDDYNEIEDEYIYRNGGYAEPEYYGYKPTGGVAPEGYYVGGYVDKMVYGRGGHIGYKPEMGNPEGYHIGGYEDRTAYGYGGKYLEEGGHIGYKPTSYTEVPEGYYIGGYIDKMAYKDGGFMSRFYKTGGPLVPTYEDAWRPRTYDQPVDNHYYGETSHITANTTTPYKMGGMMGDNKYMGYSRNQSLYGGMINTKTSPDWVDFRMKGQEGMEMQQQAQPSQLAQAREQMLSNRPSSQPMMEEEDMMMEEGPVGNEEMMLAERANQQRNNPLMPIMKILPDWFKDPNDPKGLGIFSQPAVIELRKNGFEDREIAMFNPSKITPDNPIVQFLAQSAQGMMEQQQQMQQAEAPQQMGRGGMMHYTYPSDYKSGIRKSGGMMHNLKRGQHVRFQQGGTMYEGIVKYYDPITGNFELDENY